MERLNNYEQDEPVRPVTPEEANDMRLGNMPDAVVTTVNKLISENMRLGRSVVKQKDVVAALEASGMDRAEIFARGWLDVEEIYAAYGWQVKYDKPGWNESYDAFFEFTVPRDRRFGAAAVSQCNCQHR